LSVSMAANLISAVRPTKYPQRPTARTEIPPKTVSLYLDVPNTSIFSLQVRARACSNTSSLFFRLGRLYVSRYRHGWVGWGPSRPLQLDCHLLAGPAHCSRIRLPLHSRDTAGWKNHRFVRSRRPRH